MTDRRLSVLKMILWSLTGGLVAVTVVRFVHGLGAVTHLSDAAPWGLWIGFDVMSGVALAAGGFVLAATVYVFGLERYRPFVRPAVLTALLGYAAVAVGLMYDLGIPWRIWHPMFNWQHHSVLFEVAMCVMLYLTVLSLEFAPAILEHPLFSGRLFQTVLKGLKKATVPLVIAGIVLSTLHQSSLGSLFLITPYRLHPLWYSPVIYLLFFVSAIGLGLMMVVMESLFSSYFLGHKVHVREISGLGMAASAVLWLYVALRLGDLALRGDLWMAVDGSPQGLLFLFEVGMSAVVPATLLLFRRVRSRLRGMGFCSALTILGMILYRLDVSIVSFARPEGFGYFPSWEEFAVSAGIVAAFALIFIYFAENLKVYDDVGGHPASQRKPSYDPATLHGLLPRSLAAPRRNTAAVVVGAAVALAFLPVMGGGGVSTPSAAARIVEGVARERVGSEGKSFFLTGGMVMDGAKRGEKKLLFMIDGGRDGNAVLFDHAGHGERLGSDSGCSMCHHLNMPLDCATGCYECHRDVYDSTSVFDHGSHVTALNGNAGCGECHSAGMEVKSYATSTACVECHRNQIVANPVISPPPDRWQTAPGYMDAMHSLCIECHRRAIAEPAVGYPRDLDQCWSCHDADRKDGLRQLEPARIREEQSTAARIYSTSSGEGG
jgi:Ni/Fe-hydrogenase subunit HybB-like protein